MYMYNNMEIGGGVKGDGKGRDVGGGEGAGELCREGWRVYWTNDQSHG